MTTPDLPPTDYLVMEVLAARRRLGEALWTFPSTLRPALRRLEAHNLVGWKSGVIESTCRAWLTDYGVAAWLLTDYVVRCADGSRVHDFQGQRVCPLCGFQGLVA